MRNILRLVVMVFLAAVFVSGELHAASDTAVSPMGGKKKVVVDVGNKRCPVTGKPVDGKTFYKYNNRRYGFCCPACIETFMSDFDKYSAIAEKEAAGK